MLAVLAVVELAAVTLPVLLRAPVHRPDFGIALLLASLSVTYSLLVVGWEKARQYLLFERTPTVTPNVLATWCFAAAVMLPPTLAGAVALVAAIGDWPSYNAAGHRVLYRYVYSASGAVLAATTASWVARQALPLPASLGLAAAAYLVVGVGAVSLAMCASGHFAGIRVMLHPRTHYLELITLGVALLEYGVQAARLPLIWLSLPAAVFLQRWFTRAELRARERTERPMAQDAWLHVARVVVEASATVTVVRLDSGDPIAARSVAMMQAGCDAIGTYADGTGLAILLPDCPPQNGDALARRLRAAMHVHKVPCNIASASKPRDGQYVEDLLAVAEAELVAREASSRTANPS
ncbi:MAG TPA: hypothetical protein VMB79_04470 [Jatrophihabitans sp.]|nr:hypothetical protein [Jatrophihabitans sp.]